MLLDGEVWAAARLSLTLSAFAVLLAAIVGVPLAALLGLRRGRASDAMLLVARVGMASPTVIVGLFVYALFSRRGPLGEGGPVRGRTHGAPQRRRPRGSDRGPGQRA